MLPLSSVYIIWKIYTNSYTLVPPCYFTFNSFLYGSTFSKVISTISCTCDR